MIDGRIKKYPEDFVVEEIIDGKICKVGYSIFERIKDLIPKKRDDFLHLTLVKKNWNTYDAIKKIADELHISQSRIGYAGRKDRDAVTSQRISIFNVDVSNVKRIRIKDIILKDFEYSDKRIRLGDHEGNRFTILIRNIVNRDKIPEILNKVKNEGFKNYFGEQRFGMNGNNHLIGKYMIMGNFEKAIKSMMSFNQVLMKDWGNWRKGLLNTPQRMKWERMVLEHLIYHKNDFEGAIMKIPKRIRKFYLNSYQAWVFNRVLKIYKDPPEYLPLVGSEVKFDEVTKRVLEEDGLSREDFKEMKGDIKLRGRKRKSIAYPKNLEYKIKGKNLWLRFVLEKGVYATTFLDYIMYLNK